MKAIKKAHFGVRGGLIGRRNFLQLGIGAVVAGASGCTTKTRAGPYQPSSFNLTDLEADHRLTIGLAAFDPLSGSRLGWRAQERFPYCSTFKHFLAAAMLERVQTGQERLDRLIAIREADMVPHAPVTGTAVGSSLSIESLCRAIVELSDNPAANLLIQEMGGLRTWRRWYAGLGDETTRVDRLEPDLNSAARGDLRDTTTPAQMVRNLYSVFDHDRLVPATKELLLHWMVESPTGANRLRAAAPSDWIVAHKTGTGGNGTTNDVGLLYPRDERPVHIAVFVTNASHAEFADREAVLAKAARRALRALGRA